MLLNILACPEQPPAKKLAKTLIVQELRNPDSDNIALCACLAKAEHLKAMGSIYHGKLVVSA